MNKTKRVKRKHNKSKIWKQYGCSNRKKICERSKKHRFNTKTRSFKSGGCGCNSMSGGRGLPPVPKPLVGKPWTSHIGDWPGVSGQQGVTNYFKNNTYSPVDISRTMKSTAQTNDTTNNYLSRLSNSISGNVQKGGAFSQDLRNIGQSLKYGVGNGYNSFVGKPLSVNNLPYKGQFPNNLTNQQLRNVM